MNQGQKSRPNPVIGDNYSNNRVLIIGESHYGKSEDVTNETAISLNNYFKKYNGEIGNSDYKSDFFGKIYEFMKELGWSRAQAGPVEFYKMEVAFYNYFDFPVSERGDDPLEITNNYISSAETFVEFVEKLQPTIIIVFSKRAFWSIPGVTNKENKQISLEKVYELINSDEDPIQQLTYDGNAVITSNDKNSKSRCEYCYYTLEGKKIHLFAFNHLTGAHQKPVPSLYEGTEVLSKLKELLDIE